MTKLAIIFGTPRCGSNFFLSACKRLEDLTTYGEMYHHQTPFPFCGGLEADNEFRVALLRRLAAKHPEIVPEWEIAAESNERSNIDSLLVTISHQYPGKFLNTFLSMADKKNVIFKIFPNHLKAGQMLRIIKWCDPHVLLMTRNPLDTFISAQKAAVLNNYANIDTTDLKIDFDLEAYFAYKASLQAYYDMITDYCVETNRGIRHVDYDSIHAGNDVNSHEYIRQLVSMVFAEDLKYRNSDIPPVSFRKQDRSSDLNQKVKNPNALPRTKQCIRLRDQCA
ncbi:MAG: hypothetical protein KDJ25_01690 [Rhodoblastus sp.]|nr:hypothetical protein [Rhodoblastus sp.]